METLIVEVLVRKGDEFRAAEPGETGEIAITDLHNYGAPFIRYLTGDLGVPEGDEPCRCGRQLRRLRSIEGRKNDTLRDAVGNEVDSLFLNVLFSALADKVRHFQAVQRKNGAVELKIVPSPTFDERTLEGVKRNCAKFLRGVPLRTQLVDDIPVEKNGKLRVVVVER
jgi:phenylacetate-CoA ligase